MSILAFAQWLQSTGFSTTIQTHAWIVPTLQSVHILGIGVVFVSLLMIVSRVLGLMRVDQPLADVWQRFAPFFWWSLVVMAVSGLLLVISEPVREFMTLSFRIKLVLLVVGTLSAAAFGRHVRAATRGEGMLRASTGLRAAAFATLLVWLLIIFLGRAIAYDDLIWGSWSPALLGGVGT